MSLGACRSACYLTKQIGGGTDSSNRLVLSEGNGEQLFEQGLQPEVLNTFSCADLVTKERAELMMVLLRM